METIDDHCRYLGSHPAHEWTLRERLESGSIVSTTRDADQVRRCGGVEHDHEARCCTEHDAHTMPHRGCILR